MESFVFHNLTCVLVQAKNLVQTADTAGELYENQRRRLKRAFSSLDATMVRIYTLGTLIIY